jgi:(p)ppGpp synthase/HD superfamily hydrolase
MYATTTIVQYSPPPISWREFESHLEGVDPTRIAGIKLAYTFTIEGHKDRYRDDGSHVCDHPIRSTLIYIGIGGRDADVIKALLLHDLIEDSKMLTPYAIKTIFNMTVRLIVMAVTKREDVIESTLQFLLRIIGHGPGSIIVKLCDRLDNTRHLQWCTPEKRSRQLQETKLYHVPILIPALRKYGGEWAEFADKLEELFQKAFDQY